MLVVASVGLVAVCGLALCLCLIYSGLVMAVCIANMVKSPVVGYAVKRCLPAEVVGVANGAKVQRFVAVFVCYTKRTTFALVVAICFVMRTVSCGTFLLFNAIGPSNIGEQQESDADTQTTEKQGPTTDSEM